MLWFNYLNRNDLIPIFINVIFFIIFQIIFFIYVASKQFENVLKDKLNFIKELSNNNPYVYNIIQSLKKDYIKEKNYDNIILERDKYNNKILLIYCGIPMFIIFIFIFYILFFMKSEKSWNYIDSLSLFLVTFAYITEIFFFFCVIYQYIFIGDQNIIYNFMYFFYY
jgi:hypothetical protein